MVGQMLPQPMAELAGRGRPLDFWLGCHEWLALSVGVDPRAELSSAIGQFSMGLVRAFWPLTARP